jgi:pyridoxal biosynthesis lyase PdxS
MKIRKNELDVDFIGGARPLTKDEEKRISEVIQMLKSKKNPSRKPTRKLPIKKKLAV